MELVFLTRNVKKIKDAAHKNENIEGTWKRALTTCSVNKECS